MNIIVRDPYFSSSGKSINFKSEEYPNKKFSITLETLNNYGISKLEEFNNLCMEIDPEYIQTWYNWFMLSSRSIKRIINKEEKQEFFMKLKEEKAKTRAKFEAENFIYNEDEEEISDNDDLSKIDFESVFNNISTYEVKNIEDSRTISEKEIDDLINKSIRLKPTSYKNGKGRAENYVTYKVLSLLTSDDLSNFIAGDEEEIVIKKTNKINWPSYLKDSDPKEILDFIKEKRFDVFLSEQKQKMFLKGQVDTQEINNEILNKLNINFNKLKNLKDRSIKITHETGLSSLFIAWPFIIGKTSSGNILHCPLAYRKIQIKEGIGYYKITKDKDYLINLYPILKNYNDSKRLMSDINMSSNTMKGLIIEYFKHNISLSKPSSDVIQSYKPIDKTDYFWNKFPNSSFQISNEAEIRIKPQDEIIYFELNKIKKSGDDINIPKYTSSFADNEIIKSRYFISDVDDSKAQSVYYGSKESIVIFGPPGTGKSMAITNIIGDCINKNKSCLLVSEKSTAVEVIESNLRNPKIKLNNLFLNLNSLTLFELRDKWTNNLKKINSFKNGNKEPLEKKNFWLEWKNECEKYQSIIKNVSKLNLELTDFYYLSRSIKILEEEFPGITIEDINTKLKYFKNNVNFDYENKINQLNKEKTTLAIISELKIDNDISTIQKDINNKNNEIQEIKNKLASLKIDLQEMLQTTTNYFNKLEFFQHHFLANNFPYKEILNFTNLDDLIIKYSAEILFFQKTRVRWIREENKVRLVKLLNLCRNIYSLTENINDLEQEKSEKHNDIKLMHEKENKLKSIKAEIKYKGDEKISLHQWVKDIYNSKEQLSKFSDTDITKKLLSLENKINLLNKEKNILEKLVFGTKTNTDFYPCNINQEIYELCKISLSTINIDFQNKWDNHLKTRDLFAQEIVSKILNNYYQNLSTLYNEDYSFKKEIDIINKKLKLAKRWWSSTLQKFIKKYINTLMKVFPAIAMNPEIVGNALPLEKELFDLGIFDEASQIRLHKALPAVHRCKNIIVAGDNQQLGPTDYFTDVASIEEEDFIDRDEISGFESKTLLDFAILHYRQIPLEVHYRSKSADLISFSNDYFYKPNNINLKFLDSPKSRFDGQPGVVTEEIYGKWIQGDYINIEEAKRCVELVEKYMIDHKEFIKSLGIITFNDNQRDYIKNLIQKNPKINYLLDERQIDNFFIKSIKEVQGDERDVIIFSIAYGETRSHGHTKTYVSHYGSFSKEKINVAITRSKYRMHVLKSIPSHAVRSTNESYKVFKKWLESLENPINKKDFSNYENKFRSKFEEDYFPILSEELAKINPNLQPLANYLCGSKEIDIVIYDNLNHQFVGSIELDGFQYHSSDEQAENDYEREIQLSSMGWKLRRTTYNQFYSNRVKRVLEDIEFCKNVYNWNKNLFTTNNFVDIFDM